MGEGGCFVAEREGKVLGVVGAAFRRLALPGGEQRTVIYLGDMKIDPLARGGRTLRRLVEAVQQWVAARADAAFAVVMDGTAVVPTRYTGRLGIPLFRELAKIVVLRLPTSPSPHGGSKGEEHVDAWVTTAEGGDCCYLRLSANRYACPGGCPSERSEMKPVWLLEPGGQACGRLEDTRRAKRLIADDDTEMLGAHLSCFAYRDVHAGIDLLRVGLRHAAERGFPALFVAIPAPEVENFCQSLEGMVVVRAPATIYGTALEPGAIWNINTAEI